MKNTKLAFCKFSKYPILKSIRVKFSRYKQKSMNVSVSFDTLILFHKKSRIYWIFHPIDTGSLILRCSFSKNHMLIPDQNG